MSTFSLIDAYDGLILSIVCGGAIYSNRVDQELVRRLILRVRNGIQRSSQLWQRFTTASLRYCSNTSINEFEELQALIMCHTFMTWHGGVEERATARKEIQQVMQLLRELNMMTLIPPDDPAFSYLHNLGPREQADPSKWRYKPWLEQEKRSRLLFLAFLLDVALNLYFNCVPQFHPSEIKLPLPCDDAAWDAPDAESCALALGLRHDGLQSQVNVAGSQRIKQLEMHYAIALLFDNKVNMLPRTTNVYGKFILIHALLIEVWHLQRQRALLSSLSSPSHNGQTASSPHVQVNTAAKSIDTALGRWKQSWDEDMQLQYPSSNHPATARRRVGFCRDGVHFYWLAKAFTNPTRKNDWQLPAEMRFRHVMVALRKARDWSKSDGAQRGEEPGSLAEMDDNYESEAPELDMRKIFKPLVDVYNSPISNHSSLPNVYR